MRYTIITVMLLLLYYITITFTSLSIYKSEKFFL